MSIEFIPRPQISYGRTKDGEAHEFQEMDFLVLGREACRLLRPRNIDHYSLGLGAASNRLCVRGRVRASDGACVRCRIRGA